MTHKSCDGAKIDGKVVESLRKNKGVSTHKVARAIGCSSTHIRRIEKDEILSVSNYLIDGLAAYFCVNRTVLEC